MPQLFRVLAAQIVAGADAFHRRGEVKTAEDFAGADLAWLVEKGAIEPINGTPGTLLVGADPSPAELRREVDRLQGIIEDLVLKADSTAEELKELRELRDRTPLPLRHSAAQSERSEHPEHAPDPSDRVDQIAALNATVATLTAERDAARQRADQYAARLSQAEAAARTPAAAHVGTSNQNPEPNPSRSPGSKPKGK